MGLSSSSRRTVCTQAQQAALITGRCGRNRQGGLGDHAGRCVGFALDLSLLCCSAFACKFAAYAHSSSGIGQGVSVNLADRVSTTLRLSRRIPAESSTHGTLSAALGSNG
jgi:hypothetical protein